MDRVFHVLGGEAPMSVDGTVMSRHILHQARFTQSFCSASVPLSRRRCFSALPAFKSSHTQASEHDPVPESSHHAVADRMAAGDPPQQRLKRGRASRAQQTQVSTAIVPRQTEGVEAYLASLHVAGLEPTLADLERCRPDTHAPPDSPQYPADYGALIDTLSRAFSKEQLRVFLEKCNVGSIWSRPNRTKVQYAESIIEKLWDWPCLKEIERAKRDRTEVSVRCQSNISLALYLDGADMLDMSMTYNVHISLTTEPLALRVEGLRGSLKQLSEYIVQSRRCEIVEVYIDLPTKEPIRPDMVQRISRLAGAYLQNIGSRGKLRICARSPRKLEIATRLASRAAHELNQNSRAPLLSYIPNKTSSAPTPASIHPQTFSLYPFLSPRSLPWTMNTGGAFRVRRVGEWLGSGFGEDLENAEGLAGGNGQVLTTTQCAVDLKSVLLEALPDTSSSINGSTQVITASMGHILFTTSSPSQRPTLVPPLKGHHSFSKMLKWIAGQDVRSSFVASLPGPLVDSSPAQQKILHRLTYHAIPEPQAQPRPDTAISNDVCTQTTKVLSFEAVLAQPQRDTQLFDADDTGSAAPLLDPISGPRCWKGVETTVDLMLPARPMDMRISALQSNVVLPDQEPHELQVYMANLRAYLINQDGDAVQPDPPLMFKCDGDTYILHSSASVRQSVEYIKGNVSGTGAVSQPSIIRAISESILDLESNQKTAHCEIICNDFKSEESWKGFLSNCDRLTSMTYKPMGTIGVDQPGDEHV
ncbi:hypothetical protein B0H21DRAFT_736078 [Amylocystis lapponica]|nr:hypothetical protein B0H21DRAFT_736078 [Amylocystis lapponica]